MNQDYTMEKILTITDEQREKLQFTDQTKWIKEILGIPRNKKYRIGDSTVDTKLDRLQVNDVLKCVHNGFDFYYVVVMPMGGTLAFCYTLYPIK